MKQDDRAIDWREPSASVLRKIRSADSFPGIFDTVLGMPCYLYGAHAEEVLKGAPGEIIATRDGAICRATGNGAVWITHVKRKGTDGQPPFKLPATHVLGERLTHVREVGINAHHKQLPVDMSADELRARLLQLNHDQAIHGILVQMPLPAHLSHTMVAATIAPGKDIDGISPLSAGNLFLGLPGFLSATAAAVMEMLERTRTPLEGKQVVVISRSNVVGKPLALLLLRKHATVLICHSRTSNLAAWQLAGEKKDLKSAALQ